MEKVRKKKKKDEGDRLVCLCNAVSKRTIEEAIARGCLSLGRIFDATTAGVGACGGTCQPEIRKLLEASVNARGTRK